MPAEAKQPKTKVWGGVLFLFIYYVAVAAVIGFLIEQDKSQYDSLDPLRMGIGVAATLSMLVYALLAKRLRLDIRRKVALLGILFVLLNVVGLYLGRDYYSSSPSMSEVTRIIDSVHALKPGEQLPELSRIRDTIGLVSQSIQSAPNDIPQAEQYVTITDRLLALHKRSYELSKRVHEEMLDLVSSVKKKDDLERVQKALWDNGRLNINALRFFRRQHDAWYESLTADLLARKEYYQSVANRESGETQNYLLRKWTNLEEIHSRDEAVLVLLQSKLSDPPDLGSTAAQ